MDEMLRSLLVAAGCPSDATDEEMSAFQKTLGADKQREIAVQMSAKNVKEPTADSTGVAGVGLSATQVAQIATTAAMSAVQAVLKTVNVDPATTARLLHAANGGGRISEPTTAADDGEAQINMEKSRVTQIRALAAMYPGKVGDDLIDKAIGENLKVNDARTVFLRHIAETAKPIESVRVGQDANMSSLRAALPQAICLRAGMSTERLAKLEAQYASEKPHLYTGKVHDRAHSLSGMSVLDMFRAYLTALGCSGVGEMSRPRLAHLLGPRALRAEFPRIAMLAESTSDFASITLDAINKSLRFNYLDAAKTWPVWAQRTTNNDFKNINRVVLSEAPSMVAINEGGEIKYVSLTDSKETYTLAEYKAGIKLTRRAIINDDLDAFNAIPRAQANSAARLEDDQAYAVLTANANMADTGALFNATAVTTAGGHANLVSSGTAISLSSMQIMRQKVKKQKGLAAAARLELTPKILLVPTSIEATAENFIGSEKFVATSGAPSAGGESNPFYKKMQLVSSTRLDDNSATAWYLLCDYRDGQINTFEVCFLTDEPEPIIRQETDFDTEDVKYLVRHTVAAKAIDWRGAAKNAGA